MPLNLGHRRSNGEVFVSSLRFVARTNLWMTWDDIARQQIELPELVAVFDFATVRTGWLAFEKGQPPGLVWDHDGIAATRPSDAHRRGFSVHCFLEHIGLRDLCSNAAGLCTALEEVFDLYENNPQSRRGLLPVLEAGSATLIEGPFGRFFEPHFKIVDWCPRPAGLPERGPPPKPPSGGTPSGSLAADLDDDVPF